MNCILASSLVILNLVRATIGQDTGFNCCGINMMDTRGMVVIETRRVLNNGSFVAVQVRACTTAPVSVQIWRRIDDLTFSFSWQTVINPVLNPLARTFITVNFNAPLVITNDDRLGLFSPSNNSDLTIPYGFNDSAYYLYYSTSSFSNFSDFYAGLQVTRDDLRWPRSFSGSVVFCRTPGCSDVVGQDINPGSSTITAATIAPASQCCPNPITCDTTGLPDSLQNQSNAIQNLNNQIYEITKLIETLLKNRQVTGICPQGFTPGSYGVGKCYLVIRDPASMAVAALRCQTEFNSILVQIQNILEDSFLRTLLSGAASSGTQAFWTAGMYNPAINTFFWYDESSRTKTPMTYTNWLNNIRPNTTPDTVCVKLIVAQGVTNSSYWINDHCEQPNYFICQMLKTCL